MLPTTKVMGSHRFGSALPLPLPADVLRPLVEKTKDWAQMHGACMRSKANYSADALQFAPFVLTPSPFPRAEFRKAIELQPLLNEIVHNVAHDPPFLRETLKDIVSVDEFTRNLFKIYETVLAEEATQTVSLGLVRSDLMLESACEKPGENCLQGAAPNRYCCWKQVEFNTIAAGFGWMGPISGKIHEFVLNELGRSDMLANLPPNDALAGLCGGMLEAWHLYGNDNASILFIVEEVTYNICDQRFHEFELGRLHPGIKVLRRTLTEIAIGARLNKKKELLVDGILVSVVYFRCGYEPSHYPTRREWDARLLMERSRAIKCPSIQYHLAGTKKVQEVLARPGVVERFLKDPDMADTVREIFTGLYSLDFDEKGNEAVLKAMEYPDKYVLKPQREGGGNNIYGSKIREILGKMKNSEERLAWILMERINPPLVSGYMIRPGGGFPDIVDMVSELGIFGVVLGDEKNIITNKHVGHMFRTKLATADEGGVAAGLGALDSPYLI